MFESQEGLEGTCSSCKGALVATVDWYGAVLQLGSF